jgi:hypothetical protein
MLRLADFLTGFGRARVGVGFDADGFKFAESNLLESYPIYLAAKDRGPTHKDTLAGVQAIVDLYTAWDKAEPGKGLRRQGGGVEGKAAAPRAGQGRARQQAARQEVTSVAVASHRICVRIWLPLGTPL